MPRTSTGPYIPTGYEGQLSEVKRKKDIADALLAQGLQGPGAGARSYTQLLGSLAQAFVGNRMGKKASGEEGAIRQQQMEAYNQGAQEIGQVIAEGGDLAVLFGKYGGQAQYGDLLKPVVEALSTRMKGKESFDAPTVFKGPEGTFTGQVNGAGQVRPLAGGVNLPPRLTNEEGIVTDLQGMKPGTELPTSSARFQERIATAAAGRPVSSTYVAATGKSFGDKIPAAIVENLQTSGKVVRTGLDNYPQLLEAQEIANSGNFFSGSAANLRLSLAKGVDLLGVGGSSNAEKIANSERYLQSMGALIFPILEKLRPASDTDFLAAKEMMGGNLGLSPKTIQRAVNAAVDGLKLQTARHNQAVDQYTQNYGYDPEVQAGLKNFRIDARELESKPKPPTGSSMAERVAAEMRRRAGGRN